MGLILISISLGYFEYSVITTLGLKEWPEDQQLWFHLDLVRHAESQAISQSLHRE